MVEGWSEREKRLEMFGWNGNEEFMEEFWGLGKFLGCFIGRINDFIRGKREAL